MVALNLKSIFVPLLLLSSGITAPTLKAEANSIVFVTEGQQTPISLPHIWQQNQKWQKLEVGHYKIEITDQKLLNKPLALLINSKHTQNITPYVVLINGKKVYSYGDEENVDDIDRIIIPASPFQVAPQNNAFTLEIKVFKNSVSLWPGLHNFNLVPYSDYEKSEFFNTILAAMIIGATSVVLIYHLMLWWLSKKQLYQLTFVLFCLTVIIFASIHISKVPFKIFSISSKDFWLLQAAAWFFTLYILDQFSYHLFPKSFPKWKVILTFTVAVFGLVGTYFHLYTMWAVQIYSWFFIAHLSWFVLKLPKKNNTVNKLYSLIFLLL